MDPNLIGGLVVLVLGTLIVGVVNRMQENRHKADLAKDATELATAVAERDAARRERDKERADRERWWKAYTDEATAHLKTRTEMQDSIDAMESKIRALTENLEIQSRTIAELNAKADEQHKTITELTETVARLTAELQGATNEQH